MRTTLYAAIAAGTAILGSVAPVAVAADAPAWMRAQINAGLPPHDDRTNAAVLYSETIFTVQPNGAMKRLYRTAVKILRPGGEHYGTVRIPFDPQSKVLALRAWCIPVSGKDFEVREKDSIVSAVLGVDNSELISDLRVKLMRIPAAVPGSIVGYEVEQEHRPYMKIDEWDFQDTIPVKEARYSLQLPAGWSYKSTWLNFAEQPPTTQSGVTALWTVKDLKAVPLEHSMPPWRGIAGRMSVALIPPNGQDAGMQSWKDIGLWYLSLVQNRRDSSADIKQKVSQLTQSAASTWNKMQKLASFAQSDIRYVAIELGIGGYQPRRSVDTFMNRFGDCKDKVTLLGTMLKEIGIDSHYVIVNTERGSVRADTPPNLAFNHVIAAIVLPSDVTDPAILSHATHTKLGRILYFDPTDDLTPLGRIAGHLQSSYGVLVTPEGGELVALPKLSSASNSVKRHGRLTLDNKGMLQGTVKETWLGDPAAQQRYALRTVANESERIKPTESVLAESLSSFEITHAVVRNFEVANTPFEWEYSFDAPRYAKSAGDLLLVRPRVLGTKSSGFLEARDPRVHSIEFDSPQRDEDSFEIALPPGYTVDELPPAVKFDEGPVAYQSKTEFVNGKLLYTRTFEIKELSVPADKAEKLRDLFRRIGGDERQLAVLKKQ